MQNDPSLHHDQQDTADHLVKAKGTEKAADMASENGEREQADISGLSEAEKAEQTDPKDFEPFNLDKLDDQNKAKGDD